MAKMMTKSQIAGYIANKFELTKKQGTQILEELATLAAKEAKKGFVFPGVGKLVVVNRKARMGRNPQTGEAIKIKASKKARITPLKGFKDAMMSPSAAPRLASCVWPPAPKAAAKKAAPARKAPARKAPAKRAPAKKTAAKKTTARKAPAKRR